MTRCTASHVLHLLPVLHCSTYYRYFTVVLTSFHVGTFRVYQTGIGIAAQADGNPSKRVLREWRRRRNWEAAGLLFCIFCARKGGAADAGTRTRRTESIYCPYRDSE